MCGTSFPKFTWLASCVWDFLAAVPYIEAG